MLKLSDIMNELKANSNPDDIKFMAKYGITPDKIFGTKLPVMRSLAKEIGYNHALASELWAKGYRETMILATMIDDPEEVTEAQMEQWVLDFSYWEICDQCVINLFKKTQFAWDKAVEWSAREETFVKRAGFVLMACKCVADKKAGDEKFEAFLPIIAREAGDDRNDVKKGISWALRQIGKRNMALNKKAIKVAIDIQKMDSKGAKWVASDVLRELQSDKIQERLKGKT
ncbi:MAG: DNA alkylation repair protein [Thermoplasmata archaeon]|nr:MAG: DNA alkylation repair protein [Thermoplasmata archaeon]